MIKTLTKADFAYLLGLFIVCVLIIAITWMRGTDVVSAIATSIFVLALRALTIGLLRLKNPRFCHAASPQNSGVMLSSCID